MSHSSDERFTEAAHTMKRSGLPVTYGALLVFSPPPEIIRELLCLRSLWPLSINAPLTLEETVSKAKDKARQSIKQ